VSLFNKADFDVYAMLEPDYAALSILAPDLSSISLDTAYVIETGGLAFVRKGVFSHHVQVPDFAVPADGSVMAGRLMEWTAAHCDTDDFDTYICVDVADRDMKHVFTNNPAAAALFRTLAEHGPDGLDQFFEMYRP
jgi:hypothetical protein